MATAKKKAPAKKVAAPKKAGRPSLYSEAIANRICEQLETGDISLRQICAADGMPDRTTVNRWLAARPEFASKYARARELQADVIFDGMADLEEDVLAGKVRQDAARVVFESRRWRADKLAPKKYGPKIGIGSAEGMAPLTVEIKHYGGPADADQK